MRAPNLTRQQAEERADLLAVTSYDIELDLTGDSLFRSTTTVRFSAREGAETWIDLMADRIHEARLNGASLDTSSYWPEDGVRLTGLRAENELLVRADCRYTNVGKGLHRFVDPADGAVYLYSQLQTMDAQRVFACFDQPDLKSVFQLTVLAPAGWTVVSNTVPARRVPTGDGVRIAFHPTPRLPTYLVAIVAGPLAHRADTYTDHFGRIPLGLYCRASLAEHLDDEVLFSEMKAGLGVYHRAFSVPYPFDKYDICFVPEFNVTAMENAATVTFRDDFIFRSQVTDWRYERRCATILHELAHMWFGDLVTMRWWDDLWLNESFATWAAVFAQAESTQYRHAWTTFLTLEKAAAYRQDQLATTHSVAADIPDVQAVEVNFDAITYNKGASVLKQLVAYVGLDAFLAGVRLYFERCAWGNATLRDLLATLEEASGRDLSNWSAQWLQSTGMSRIEAAYTVDGVELRQGPEHRFHRLAIGMYEDDADGRLVRTHRVELDVVGGVTPVPALAGVRRAPLMLANDDDLTYCKLRLDPASLSTVVARVGDIAEPLPRALCWSVAWDLTRDAELRARDFVAMVARDIAVEAQAGVAERLLDRAQEAIRSFTDPAWTTQGWRILTHALLRLAHQSTDPDRQLVYVTALTTSVLDDEPLNALRGWLSGTAPLAGLRVDADLRWGLLQALVAHGAAGPDDIEAELRGDPTAAGHRHAERARAQVPTDEAKARAWERAVHDDSLSNAVHDALIAGLTHPGHGALLGGYVKRYFAEVADVWAGRPSVSAQRMVRDLFPAWAVEPDTVAAADEWLAGDHPPALRRLVVEGRDAIVRALAARHRDAG